MMKLAALSIMLAFFSHSFGQVSSAGETVKNYSIAQKRLLLASTLQFENFISQNNLDQDSLTLMACRITGLPFLLPYAEGILEDEVVFTSEINAGNITRVKQLLNSTKTENKMSFLFGLAIWYLHQPGKHHADLDSAAVYIEYASTINSYQRQFDYQQKWRFLKGELFFQRGDTANSRKAINEILSLSGQTGDVISVARAYHYLGKYAPNGDSLKRFYYQKSLAEYVKAGIKEKEIELSLEICLCNTKRDIDFSETALSSVLSLMHSAGFKHVLYAEYFLSYWFATKGNNYIEELNHATLAIQNMRWSKIYAVSGSFMFRIGNSYGDLGKEKEALEWFKKAIAEGQNENHLFWYKNLLVAPEILFDLDKPKDALVLIDSVTRKFPPVTLWEQMQITMLKGKCFKLLGNATSADRYFMNLLYLAQTNPMADTYGEFSQDFLEIARYYVEQKNSAKGRLFLKQGLSGPRSLRNIKATEFLLQYKIDSINGNFRSALENHLQYQLHHDSDINMEQRIQLDKLTVQFETKKKDQDIQILQKQGVAQQAELKQNTVIKTILIASTVLLLIIIGLLFNRFKLKQRANKQISYKNELLEHLVTEKEWLLKEVHHRVKNNLQTVVSLLELQSENLGEEALSAIQDSQNRIYAMSLIHQKLYQRNNIASINMQPYLIELTAHLQAIYNPEHKIRFDLQVADVELDVSQAIPVGLIVNEAVTNSIKYAFNAGTGCPQIAITLTQPGNKAVKLVMADNGIGLPLGFDTEETAGLGFKLMRGLVDDIEGVITTESGKGTLVTGVFNATKPFQQGEERIIPENEVKI